MINRIFQNNLYFLVLISLFTYLYVKFLLSPTLTILETDEVVSISTFADPRTIFLKYIPNNHALMSILGIAPNYLIGVNVVLLRSISFIILFLIFLKIYRETNQKNLLIYTFVFFSFDHLFIDYSFLFRGYILSGFLFVLIFFRLIKINKKILNTKFILFICSLLIFHNLSNIYLVLPIVIMVSFRLFKEKKPGYLLFFVIPTIILFLISILTTGIFLNKNIVPLNELSISNFLINLPTLFNKGIYAIFFPETGSLNIFNNPGIFFKFLADNIFLLLLLLLSFVKSIYKLFKSPVLIDYVIILFILTIFLVNKIPPERIFISFYFFLILYILYEFNILEKKNKKIFSILGFIIIFINFNNHNFFTGDGIELIDNNTLKKITKTNCKLEFSSKLEFEYHYFYYKYLNECKKKPNVFEFYNFYKTRIN